MGYRILLVEDCEDDAELTSIMLADAGVAERCRCVDTEAALASALEGVPPDAVVSDLSLPGFCPQRALRMVRARAPGTPFIVLSGVVPPDHPVFEESQPPDAWLDKDHLHELPALLERLLGARGT